MLLSKKDLLRETGISYGQLYRWKREGLIPEEWFIKQPSFTGQETFFPKEKILRRIRAIQELKDQYSLEELAKMLSPEVADRNFSVEDLQLVEEIDPGLIPCFCHCFGKKSFTYLEMLVLAALSSCRREFDLSLAEVEELCLGVRDSLPNLRQTDLMLVLVSCRGEYYTLLYSERASFFLDRRFKTVKEIRLDDLSSAIKLKYRKAFQFRFDQEEEEKRGAATARAVVQ